MERMKRVLDFSKRLFFTLIVIIPLLFYPIGMMVNALLSKKEKQIDLSKLIQEKHFVKPLLLTFTSIIIVAYLPVIVLIQFIGNRFRQQWLKVTPYEHDNFITDFIKRKWLGDFADAQNNRVFVYFLFPSFGAFALFVLYPFLHGFYLSFTDWTGLNTGNETIIGLEHYA